MRLRALLVTSLLALPTVALASTDSVAQRIATVTSGIVQVCPPEYERSVCVRADDSVVKTAGVIKQALSALMPGAWRDGPEQGISGDIPTETLTLHLLPRGEGQTLTVIQPFGAATPPITGSNQHASTTVTIENPENAYFVVLDEQDQPVRDLTTVRNGTYTVITSSYGRATQRQQVKVDASGLKKLTLPRLAAAPSKATVGGLVLPTAPGYLFLVFTASGTLVLDLGDLQPGSYDLFSYRDGKVGPLAGAQEVKLGQVSRPQFNAAFVGSSAPTPAVAAPASASPAPASSSGGQCWVNGYRRSNGTYVSGYYRRC